MKQMDDYGNWALEEWDKMGGQVLDTPDATEYPDRVVRKFDTGATRDTDQGKPDYEGFISPLVTKRYGEYMHKHRLQADGSLRTSDNWQKGMPLEQYVKSLNRHVLDLLLHHDGFADEAVEIDLEDVLCACLFNVSGALFETVRKRIQEERDVIDRAAEGLDPDSRYNS